MEIRQCRRRVEAYHERQLAVRLEYEALSEDYWRTRKLINVLRVLGWIALTIAVIIWLAYIFVGGTALAIAELICNVCWVGLAIIADEIELSILRQWRLAMIKYVGWDLTDDD